MAAAMAKWGEFVPDHVDWMQYAKWLGRMWDMSALFTLGCTLWFQHIL